MVGELLQASPKFFNHDQTKLLCEGYSWEGEWRWRLIQWLQNRSFGKGLAGNLKLPDRPSGWSGRPESPGFCGDGVIYSRMWKLFRVDLNGSNNAAVSSRREPVFVVAVSECPLAHSSQAFGAVILKLGLVP